MALISTARALDDNRFLWRVRSAALSLAVSKYSSADPAEKALAESILDYPMQANLTLEALVANAPAVNAAVIVSENNTVSTEGVTDVMITNAVNTYWAAVAKRYLEKKSQIPPNSPAA